MRASKYAIARQAAANRCPAGKPNCQATRVNTTNSISAIGSIRAGSGQPTTRPANETKRTEYGDARARGARSGEVAAVESAPNE